jgi:hypothetical protein
MKMDMFCSRAWSTLAMLSVFFLTASAHASTVTFNLGTVFSDGSVAPDGPAPYATVTLDDGGVTGQVNMTASVSADVGQAFMVQLYLNLDPALDVTLLSFSYVAGLSDGPDAENGKGGNGIFVGTDAFQSDGDGAYDILFDFPPPPGSGGSKFEAGETVVYTITSTQAITASSFNFLSAEGGGEGTYLAASKFNATGPLQDGSAWVGDGGFPPVPVPATVWLFGSGLIGLVGIARRKKKS